MTGVQVEQSLSVVLPVYNAEKTLSRQITKLLEVLPDITSDFEILVVDDGSTDHTEEVAFELSRYFPQLNVTRHNCRRGTDAAVRTGMMKTRGDVVFVQDEKAQIRVSDLKRLWELRHDDQLVMARVDAPNRQLSPQLLNRLSDWGSQLRESAEQEGQCGIQMIRRDALAQLDNQTDVDRQVRITPPTGIIPPTSSSPSTFDDMTV
jgi:glycosyltransferase involved in cell wall biosynthesis